MNCDEVKERLFISLDEGNTDPEVESHCLSCSECRDAMAANLDLFRGLESLPKPRLISGEAFVRTFPVEAPPSTRPVSTWEALCGLLAQRPAFGVGLALICVVLGVLIAREWGSADKTLQHAQSLENLTEEVTVLNESLAVLQLQRDSASERLRGVGWIQAHGESNQDLIDALRLVLENDDNVNVKLAAIDALARFAAEPSVRLALIQSLERPQSPLVRIALIEKLVPLDEPASREIFRAIVADEKSHEAVRERARSAMELENRESV